MSEKSITCPRCNMTSYHPKDVEHRYCGNCHMYHDDMLDLTKTFRFTALKGFTLLKMKKVEKAAASFNVSLDFSVEPADEFYLTFLKVKVCGNKMDVVLLSNKFHRLNGEACE